MPKLHFDIKSIQEFPPAFEKYFNDHFGFRNKLIFLNNYIKVKWLKKSPLKKVVLGKKGWLYLNSNSPGNDFQKAKSLSELQLRAWTCHNMFKRNWLARHGIKYLFVVAPDKRSIYPEYLPNRFFHRASDKSRLDVLETWLAKSNQNNILDLRGPILEAKTEGLLYYRTDTHWNGKGAFIGYKAIMDRIAKWFPEEKQFRKSKLNFSPVDRKGLDLSTMLGLGNFFSETTYKMMNIPKWYSKETSNPDIPQITILKSQFLFETICGKSKIKAIVFRDSFFISLIPLFSNHFSRAVYLWHPYDQAAMEKLTKLVKPDLVIEETVERALFEDLTPIVCHNMIGEYLIDRGENLRAVSQFKKAMDSSPGNPELINTLGFALLKAHRLYKAVRYFKKTLSIDPGNSNAVRNYRLCSGLMQKIDNSILMVKDKLNISPEKPELIVKLARLYQKRGNHDIAARFYKKALAIHPGYIDALEGLAVVFAETEKYDSSISCFKKILFHYPDRPDIYYNLACLYAKKSMAGRSIACLEKAIEKGYKKWDLIKTDKDLDNIRNTLYFTEFLNRFKGKI